MDPFTQRMLEKAEQRSRALGISNAAASKFPVSDKSGSLNINTISGSGAKTMASQQQQEAMHIIESGDGNNENKNKLHVIENNIKDPNMVVAPEKVLRQFSTVNKENHEMDIEINIVTDKNVEVQVQVEEHDLTEECIKKQNSSADRIHVKPTAKIRDTSRNRLQRLGALYSNTDGLSSPIHRTEGKFHAEDVEEDCSDAHTRKGTHRLGKLAALANTINQWEDDTSSHGTANISTLVQPPPKPDLPSRGKYRDEKSTSTGKDNDKHLKWDPKVINSLEAQGFQRRQSSALKMSYEFTDKENDKMNSTVKPKDESGEGGRTVGKLNINKFPASVKYCTTENQTSQIEKKLPTVKSGLVSGRAAIFESQAQINHQKQHETGQKDPTELSLKERMKLFEKNKGEALIPKAAFGMAAPINKIIQNTNFKKNDLSKGKSNVTCGDSDVNYISSSTSAPVIKAFADSKVREKVNALVKATAENTIKEDIKKQREEDLQLLTNRFNKQKDFPSHQQQSTILKNNYSSQNQNTPKAPPLPPPLPVNIVNINSKRRSPGNVLEDDDSKRVRTAAQESSQRKCPSIIPHIDTTECSESENENNRCTTASASALSVAEYNNAAVQPLHESSNMRNNYDEIQDDEPEDSFMESEDEDSSVGIQNDSLGREVMQVVEKNDRQATNKAKGVHYADRDSYFGDNTTDTSNNSSYNTIGVDDYLDEALGDNDNEADEEDTSLISKDSKGTTSSESFSFRKANRDVEFNKNDIAAGSHSSNYTGYMQPVKSELSVNNDSDNTVTLVHTVSIYRRQQNENSASSTPVRKVCREQKCFRSALEKLDAAAGNTTNFEQNTREIGNDEANLVQDKIKKLLDEVCKQQQIITQTSQALNLCAATIEFSGSTESVEGERHLLVATHRRQACLDEVQRLRVEKLLHPIGGFSEKARLTIKEITVPLRQDYIRKLSLDTISGHHLVCLIKYNEHVLATKTIPTLPGLLSVKFPDVLQLNHVYADFKVILEIYGMTAQREVLPHEVKYHINLNKKGGIKTPKKKALENRLVMPPVQSPAGPQAVRKPALVQYGYAIFSLSELHRTLWTLTQVLGVSPLEGSIHMKVDCEVVVSLEYKGFLTMFEDISGFGAWHRRWYYLKGTMLNYWKYPDDEKKKAPLGTIDLHTCSSQQVAVAPRDVCARFNTILLECERPYQETDRESLTIIPNGRTTKIRYLLSADTKNERDEWCAFINKALVVIRSWDQCSAIKHL